MAREREVSETQLGPKDRHLSSHGRRAVDQNVGLSRGLGSYIELPTASRPWLLNDGPSDLMQSAAQDCLQVT